MKKLSLVIFFLVFFGLALFGEPAEQEEIDYLLFLPNSSDGFVNVEQARIQLDNTARYLKGRNLVPGQVIVYGYAAFSLIDIDPMDISSKRALFVIDELQKRGIPRNLFADHVGHGSVYLWGSNSSEEDRVPNRRVRILIDGTLITPEVIAAPNIADSMLDDKIIIEETEEPVKQKSTAVKKEKSDFNFPWWLLLLLLIPLLFLLLRGLKNKKREEKPAVKKEPVREVAKQEPAPQPIAPPQQVVQQAAPPPPKPEPAKPEPVAPESLKPEPPKPEPAPQPIAPAPISAPAEEHAAPHVETYVDVVDLEEEIRRRAYFHSQRHDYCDMDGDWYVAIPRVRVEFEEKGYETYTENGTWWAKKTIVKKV